MAQRGHAQDCPGCEWDDLLPQDVAWFKANSVTKPEHHRVPAPVKPAQTLPQWFWCVAAACVLAVIVPGSPEWLALIPMAVFGAFCVRHGYHHDTQPGCPWCRQNEIHTYAQRRAAWKLEQIEAWNDWHAQGWTWPCPGCGQLGCGRPAHRVVNAKMSPSTARRR